MICPDCDEPLDMDEAWSESRLRPADWWRCPGGGTRWARDPTGLLAEA